MRKAACGFVGALMVTFIAAPAIAAGMPIVQPGHPVTLAVPTFHPAIMAPVVTPMQIAEPPILNPIEPTPNGISSVGAPSGAYCNTNVAVVQQSGCTH